MAYTFLKAMGQDVGKSLVEADKLDVARGALEEAEAERCSFSAAHRPRDWPTNSRPMRKPASSRGTVPSRRTGWGSTSARQRSSCSPQRSPEPAPSSGMGPWAYLRCRPLPSGTTGIAEALAENAAAITIVGGGDSVSALKQAGVADRIKHISTGGGASLEFLEGKRLPGVAALSDAPSLVQPWRSRTSNCRS